MIIIFLRGKKLGGRKTALKISCATAAAEK